MITCGLSDTARKLAAIACGIWLKVIHQPRIEAEAMMRKTMPVDRGADQHVDQVGTVSGDKRSHP